MLKRDELADPNSCWNRARDDERVFVLLERDIAAPDTIRDWRDRRLKYGKNEMDDPQLVEAIHCANEMEKTTGPQLKKLIADIDKYSPKCDLCGDVGLVLMSKCHPSAPLRMEIDNGVLAVYCYLPQCNRLVAKFNVHLLNTKDGRARCPVVVSGHESQEQCALEAGHAGRHMWGEG